MIAGSIGLLEDTADEILESHNSGGFATLDVQGTQEYLDNGTVQHGRVCDLVESSQEEIHVVGGEIDVEQVATEERVWTEWVADVTGAGFVVAERTGSGEPPFPFGVFTNRTGQWVTPTEIDTAAFVKAQRKDDDLIDVWFAGRDETGRDSVSMEYHDAATLAVGETPNVGVGFVTGWGGTTARGIAYASGYVAIFEQSWGPIQFASFLRDEILPHAYIPDQEDEEAEQTTLEEEEDVEEEAYVEGICEECGHERSKTTVNEYGDRVCILCEESISGGVSADD